MTSTRDRMVKSDLYLGAGVREVWLVDARSEKIELRTRGGLKVLGKGQAAVSQAVPGFRLELEALFRS